MVSNEPVATATASLDELGDASRSPAPPLSRSFLRIVAKALVLAAVSLLLGGLTSLGQAVLPDALRPLANSASGWTVPTALLVWAMRERGLVSAVFGALSFECLVIGYVVVSQLRGFDDAETLFLVIGLVGGPIIGAAASWLHRRRGGQRRAGRGRLLAPVDAAGPGSPAVGGHHAAIGAGVLAGVLLGEAVWGFTVVFASTGWLFWSFVAGVGVGLLVGTSIRHALGWRQVLVALGATAAVAAALLGVYTVLS
jgi:hypothetical protein